MKFVFWGILSLKVWSHQSHAKVMSDCIDPDEYVDTLTIPLADPTQGIKDVAPHSGSKFVRFYAGFGGNWHAHSWDWCLSSGKS